LNELGQVNTFLDYFEFVFIFFCFKLIIFRVFRLF